MIWLTLAFALPAQDDATRAYEADVAVMDKVLDTIRDCTWTFHKEERVAGVWLDRQVMAVKHRLPDDFYVKWSGDVNAGREVLYSPASNNGKLLVNVSAFVPNISVSTTGSTAMEDNRHSIPDLSAVRVARRIVSDVARVRAATWAPTVQELGPRRVHGEASRCYHAVSRKDLDPGLYGYESELCFSTRTKLPVSIRTWDVEGGTLELVEQYSWQDLQLNPGLTDADFQPDHEGYGF
jgi:hypothetical protein